MAEHLKIDFLTLFPKMLEGFLSESMLGRARQAGILDINVYDIRDWATSKHKNTDDRPFGGGPGMLMKPGIVPKAYSAFVRTSTRTVSAGSEATSDHCSVFILPVRMFSATKPAMFTGSLAEE